MAIDIKAQIGEIVEKIKADPKLLQQFKTDPAKAIRALLPFDVSEEVLDKIIDGVKAALTADNLSKAAGALGKLFGKN